MIPTLVLKEPTVDGKYVLHRGRFQGAPAELKVRLDVLVLASMVQPELGNELGTIEWGSGDVVQPQAVMPWQYGAAFSPQDTASTPKFLDIYPTVPVEFNEADQYTLFEVDSDPIIRTHRIAWIVNSLPDLTVTSTTSINYSHLYEAMPAPPGRHKHMHENGTHPAIREVRDLVMEYEALRTGNYTTRRNPIELRGNLIPDQARLLRLPLDQLVTLLNTLPEDSGGLVIPPGMRIYQKVEHP